MAAIDPYRAYTFRVKVSGISDSNFHFTKCSSFSVTVENQEYPEAGRFQVTQQIPMQVNYEPVTLSYGVTNSRALWKPVDFLNLPIFLDLKAGFDTRIDPFLERGVWNRSIVIRHSENGRSGCHNLANLVAYRQINDGGRLTHV